MHRLLVVALILFCIHCPANAKIETGNEWLPRCTAEDHLECIVYLKGFSDMHDIAKILWDTRGVWCAPEAVTYGQLRSVVVKWMRDNPQRLNDAFQVIVTQALADAFPCK